ncbi:histone deacetylase [Desulfobacterota bacterium M19]
MASEFQNIIIIDSPAYDNHDTGGGEYPETPERVRAVRERLNSGPLAACLKWVVPRPAARERLIAVHDENYLFRFEEAVLAGQTWFGHRDNQICFDSFDSAVMAAGAGPAGVDLLEDGEAELVFCPVRPPGHHAERAMALGFCFLNNVAIAADYWRQAYGRKRIFILDFDAHHGNGIQAAFETSGSVFYASIHEHPTYSFPGSGYAEERGFNGGKGTTLNIPLPPGAGDDMVLEVMRDKIGPVLEKFRPEALIIAAGFDAHGQDDMSGLDYSTILYSRLGGWIRKWAGQFCGSRVLSILEGGYNPPVLALSVEAYLAGLAYNKKYNKK